MSILKLKKVVIILDEFKNNTNCDDRLYELLRDTLEQQKEIVKSYGEAMSKYSSSMDETMLLLDNRCEKESKEKLETMKHMSTEHKWTVVITSAIVSLSFVILAIAYLLIYFFSPSDITATASSTAISSSVSSSKDDNENCTSNGNIKIDTGGETNAK